MFLQILFIKSIYLSLNLFLMVPTQNLLRLICHNATIKECAANYSLFYPKTPAAVTPKKVHQRVTSQVTYLRPCGYLSQKDLLPT